MKTEIRYTFEDQCFEIKGRSQMACDDTYVLNQSFRLFILKTFKKKNGQNCVKVVAAIGMFQIHKKKKRMTENKDFTIA
jgi:hypothetical protein